MLFFLFQQIYSLENVCYGLIILLSCCNDKSPPLSQRWGFVLNLNTNLSNRLESN